MPTLGKLVEIGRSRLADGGIDDAQLEAQILLADATQLTRSRLLARLRDTATEAETEAFTELMMRRLSREPLAYILGRREFFNRVFAVNPDVLIPRPETELLVHRALEVLPDEPGSVVFDIGTGSGAIGLSILGEQRSTRLLATDISLRALRVARVNAERFDLSRRADFVACDLLNGLVRPRGSNLIIVSNLPYIPADRTAGLQAEVRDFEPHVALFSESGGLATIGRLLGDLDRLLVKGEHALLEIDEEQGAAAISLVGEVLPDFEVSLEQDSSGMDRMVELRKCVDR